MRQWVDIDEAVQSVFKSAQFIKGEEVEKFEKAFSRYCGSDHCIGCANGTDALTYLLKALVSTPLILGCAAGIFFSRFQLSFPVFIDHTFQLMTSVTMPLALISIGGSLHLKELKHNTKISLVASLLKILILPAIGYFLFGLFSVTGIPFKAGMIFFALPTSTAIYVLSAQLNSDVQLASAAIMLSTLLSFISLSAALLI